MTIIRFERPFSQQKFHDLFEGNSYSYTLLSLSLPNSPYFLQQDLIQNHPALACFKDVHTTFLRTISGEETSPALMLFFHGSAIPDLLHQLGRPLVHITRFESNPGVWIWKDTATEILCVCYSDEHRKNKYKGTSWEFILPTPLSEQMGRTRTSAPEQAQPAYEALAHTLSRLKDHLDTTLTLPPTSSLAKTSAQAIAPSVSLPRKRPSPS